MLKQQNLLPDMRKLTIDNVPQELEVWDLKGVPVEVQGVRLSTAEVLTI